MEQLHEFLAQDVEQNQPAEEQSTLAQAVAQEMTPAKQVERIRDRTWHQSDMEKRRRMAQPTWKDAMVAQDALLAQHQKRVMELQRPNPSQQTSSGMQTLSTIPEGQTLSTASTDQTVQPAEPASSTSESQDWDAWCDFQESASSNY